MSKNILHLVSESEGQTDQLGAAIAEGIDTGIVIALNGTLGAGKTRLVQAIGTAWQVNRRDIVSPTFTLCTSHLGKRPFSHIDVYRLVDDDQWLELEFDELIDDGKIVFIEWAEKFEHLLPLDRLTISIEITAPESRKFILSGGGPKSDRIIEQVAAKTAE